MRSRSVGSRMSTTRTRPSSSSRTDGSTRTESPALVASSDSSSTTELGRARHGDHDRGGVILGRDALHVVAVADDLDAARA